MDVLRYLLGAPLARGPWPSLDGWLAHVRTCPFSAPLEQALWSGFHADRLGYAFAGGYGAALARLLAGTGVEGTACLAATEAGGIHPKAMNTRLDDGRLDGEKTFATLASVADKILVVAREGGENDGKNRLRVAVVTKDAAGLTITPRGETPFAPEIPHAILRLNGVRPETILPGDGYANYVKPFRTIEDIHVLGASLGYLFGAARAFEWETAVVAELASLVVALDAHARADVAAPSLHLALAGNFTTVRRLASSLDWSPASEEERMRWHRDTPLLLVAETVRRLRTEAALLRLSSAGGWPA